MLGVQAALMKQLARDNHTYLAALTGLGSRSGDLGHNTYRIWFSVQSVWDATEIQTVTLR